MPPVCYVIVEPMMLEAMIRSSSTSRNTRISRIIRMSLRMYPNIAIVVQNKFQYIGRSRPPKTKQTICKLCFMCGCFSGNVPNMVNTTEKMYLFWTCSTKNKIFAPSFTNKLTIFTFFKLATYSHNKCYIFYSLLHL